MGSGREKEALTMWPKPGARVGKDILSSTRMSKTNSLIFFPLRVLGLPPTQRPGTRNLCNCSLIKINDKVDHRIEMDLHM